MEEKHPCIRDDAAAAVRSSSEAEAEREPVGERPADVEHPGSADARGRRAIQRIVNLREVVRIAFHRAERHSAQEPGGEPAPTRRRYSCDRGFLRIVGLADRKSTRLNSSHVAISYA